MEKVKIYDTTLRDGMQAEGVSFSAEDKLMIARRLDEFGIDYIEGGFPLSNPKEEQFFQDIGNIDFKHPPRLQPSAVPAGPPTKSKTTQDWRH